MWKIYWNNKTRLNLLLSWKNCYKCFVFLTKLDPLANIIIEMDRWASSIGRAVDEISKGCGFDSHTHPPISLQVGSGYCQTAVLSFARGKRMLKLIKRHEYTDTL